MISSNANPQIKNIIQLMTKAKARKEQDCFVVEGLKMFLEIPKQDLLKVYVSETFISMQENANAVEKFSFEIISDKIFKSLSDTVTPQGILALVRCKHYNLGEIISKRKSENINFLILEDIRDPGNLGTMIRTGEGAGISGIIMSKDTVDIYNPKVIRSTMGSIFRVPFLYTENLVETVGQLKKNKIKIYSAHLEGKNIFETEVGMDSAVIIGNEANGISEEVKNISDELIRIPMQGRVESLNAAISSAIIMYYFLHKC